jgi:hypothetical protein
MSKQNNKRSSSAEPASARADPLDLDLLVDDPKADLPTISDTRATVTSQHPKTAGNRADTTTEDNRP